MSDTVYDIHTIKSGTPPSPKRKKVRAKYAPKACVSCRRSKLKCSGENPCQRCHDGGRRCFYSEDQTAAEALQNLSRPPPVQNISNGDNSRSVTQMQESIERSVEGNIAGLSMEARMARVEGLLETLMHGQRLARASSRDSVDRERGMSDGGHSISNGRPNDGLPTHTSSSAHKRPHALISRDSPLTSIRTASRDLPFPDSSGYEKRISLFFQELNPLYPCVHEAEFRARSQAMLSSPVVRQKDECLLALNFIIMACSELLILENEGGPGPPNGFQWFKLADDLVSKRKVAGRGDLSLIQCLLFQAVYFMHIDLPNAAYNTIGMTCRFCIQSGLHRQFYWGGDGSHPLNDIRANVFWTVYFTDRQISLSCGRPYGLRDSDIEVQHPVFKTEGISESGRYYTGQYLSCMISLAEFGGQVWDYLFAPGADKSNLELETSRIDGRLKQWWDLTLAHFSLLEIPRDGYEERSRFRQRLLVRTRLHHLRLLVWRNEMISLNFRNAIGRLCGDLALEIVRRTIFHSIEEAAWNSFHFEMVTSLAPAMLILATLLCRFHDTFLRDQLSAYSKEFTSAVNMIRNLGLNFQLAVAHRILRDFTPLIDALKPLQEKVGKGDDLTSFELPRNIGELLPYRDVDWSQQAGLLDYNTGADGDEGPEYEAGLDSGDYDRQPAVKGYGVPWL